MNHELRNHCLPSTVLEAYVNSFVLVVSNTAILGWVKPDPKKLTKFYKSWNRQVAKRELETLAHNFLLFPPKRISNNNLGAQD